MTDATAALITLAIREGPPAILAIARLFRSEGQENIAAAIEANLAAANADLATVRETAREELAGSSE
jgi:hypothetical protein